MRSSFFSGGGKYFRELLSEGQTIGLRSDKIRKCGQFFFSSSLAGSSVKAQSSATNSSLEVQPD